MAAQRHDVVDVVGGQPERRPHELCQLDEQRHRAGLLGLGHRRSATGGGGHDQWLDRVLLLPAHVHRPPAGRQQGQTRGCVEQLGDHRGAHVGQLLEVVQQEEHPPVGDVVEEGRRVPPLAGEAEHVGQRRPRDPRIGHVAQRDEVDAVGKAVADRLRHRHGQSGLARTAGSGERQQSGLRARKHLRELLELALAADEGVRGRRQVRPGAEAAQWREVLLQTGHDELVQLLHAGDVLEAVVAERLHRRTAREAPADQPPGGLREHDLPAVRRAGDARREVDVHPDVPVLVGLRLSRVQPHPDPHVGVFGPAVLRERPLCLHACLDGVAGRREGHEEAVALGAELVPVPGVDGGAHEQPLLVEDLCVVLAEPGQQLGRALHVAEEHRHGAGWQRVLHATNYRRRLARRGHIRAGR